MSKLMVSIAAAAAIALSAAGAAAQQTAPEKKVIIPSKTFYKGQEATQYLARDRLIGAKVLNKDGQIIGDVEDLIVSTDGNRIEGVIMGVGGFLGVGEKKVGVRYSALNFETRDGQTVLVLPQASKEVLAALEPYQRATPKRSMVDRATETAKDLADKAKEATKKAGEAARNAYDKATGKDQPKQ